MLKIVLAVALIALAGVYVRGFRRLRGAGHPPPRWRLALYLLGLASIAAAILSPIDDLAEERFAMHMVQHILLTMSAAPLVLLGNPLAVVLWGLPPRARRWLSRPLTRDARFRRVLCVLTSLPVAWLVYVVDLWVWHAPVLYDLAIEHEFLHIVEHAFFFVTSILFWWPIVRPAPRLRPRAHAGFEILYLVAATAQNTALGVLLSLPERSFYPHYERAAARLGVSALDDQALAGGIMWANGHMYLLPILLILYDLARRSALDGRDDLAELGTRP